ALPAPAAAGGGGDGGGGAGDPVGVGCVDHLAVVGAGVAPAGGGRRRWRELRGGAVDAGHPAARFAALSGSRAAILRGSMNRLFRDAAGGPLCPQGSVACIGAFDGLHLGHQALLGHAAARARALGVASVALSFEPLPREVFARPAPPRLMLSRQKVAALWELGIDLVGLLRFDAAFAAM